MCTSITNFLTHPTPSFSPRSASDRGHGTAVHGVGSAETVPAGEAEGGSHLWTGGSNEGGRVGRGGGREGGRENEGGRVGRGGGREGGRENEGGRVGRGGGREGVRERRIGELEIQCLKWHVLLFDCCCN